MKADKIILYAIVILLGFGFLLTIFGIVYGNISAQKERIARNNSSTALVEITPTSSNTITSTPVLPSSEVISTPQITSTTIIPTSSINPIPSNGATPSIKTSPTPSRVNPTPSNGASPSISASPSITPSPTSVPTSTPNPTPTSITYIYQNGNFTQNQPYNSPGGTDSIAVTINIQNDFVTSLSNSYTASNGQSENYQDAFEAQIHSKVVGKNLGSLGALSRVAGASLTTTAFNQAITKIKNNAAN